MKKVITVGVLFMTIGFLSACSRFNESLEISSKDTENLKIYSNDKDSTNTEIEQSTETKELINNWKGLLSAYTYADYELLERVDKIIESSSAEEFEKEKELLKEKVGSEYEELIDLQEIEKEKLLNSNVNKDDFNKYYDTLVEIRNVQDNWLLLVENTDKENLDNLKKDISEKIANYKALNYLLGTRMRVVVKDIYETDTEIDRVIGDIYVGLAEKYGGEEQINEMKELFSR